MTAKEIAHEVQCGHGEHRQYLFTPEQLQYFIDQLCMEHRVKCFTYTDTAVKELGGLNQQMRHRLLTAPQPEGL